MESDMTSQQTDTTQTAIGGLIVEAISGRVSEPTRFVIFNATESLWGSVMSDVFTLGGLALCIWLSFLLGGGWWTFVTTILFVVSLTARVLRLHGARSITLKTKQDAIRWANSLPDDGISNSE